MLKSLWRLDHVPLGFEPQRLLAAHIRLAGPLHQAKESQVQFWERTIEAVRALPSVESVTVSGGIPPNGSPELMTFSRSDAPPPEPGHRGDGIMMQPADAEYFRVLGIPLLQGNLFAEKQSDSSPLVAVVNEALARKYFANENVIGKRVMGHLNGDWKTIVGVVGDAKNDGLPGDVRPEVYEPYRQFPYISDMYLLVRTAAAPEYLTPEIGRAIARFDPSQPVVFTTVEENLDTFRSQPRFDTMLLSGFAGVALLLAMLGIYGIFSYATVQRTREIGVRMALGASPSAILWWTITSTLPLIVWGIISGVGGSLILSRYLSSLLYEVRPRDATTFLFATLALGLTAFLAILLPARRAASLDPTISLRSE